jgi:hypothetical protein
MKTIEVTRATFRGLEYRDATQFRGYVAGMFRQYPLLHHHFDDGLRYAYPLVQYKMLSEAAVIIALGGLAPLIGEVFLKIESNEKSIATSQAQTAVTSEMYTYRFSTPYLGLNQENYAQYRSMSALQRKALVERVLVGNILSFWKGIGHYEEQRVFVTAELRETRAVLKDVQMQAFTGNFVSNALLPCGVGLGKSVARGFGAIEREGICTI